MTPDASSSNAEYSVSKIRRNRAAGEPPDDPEFQRKVGRSQLQRRQADMVMPIHEARAYDMAVGSDDGVVLAPSTQLLEVVDGEDDAVALEDPAILEQSGTTVRLRAADDRATMNKSGNQETDLPFWNAAHFAARSRDARYLVPVTWPRVTVSRFQAKP